MEYQPTGQGLQKVRRVEMGKTVFTFAGGEGCVGDGSVESRVEKRGSEDGEKHGGKKKNRAE